MPSHRLTTILRRPPSASFRSFSSLPVELQLMIWEFAAETWKQSSFYFRFPLFSRLPTPPMALYNVISSIPPPLLWTSMTSRGVMLTALSSTPAQHNGGVVVLRDRDLPVLRWQPAGPISYSAEKLWVRVNWQFATGSSMGGEVMLARHRDSRWDVNLMDTFSRFRN